MPALNSEARSTTDSRMMIAAKQIAARRTVTDPPTIARSAWHDKAAARRCRRQPEPPRTSMKYGEHPSPTSSPHQTHAAANTARTHGVPQQRQDREESH